MVRNAAEVMMSRKGVVDQYDSYAFTCEFQQLISTCTQFKFKLQLSILELNLITRSMHRLVDYNPNLNFRRGLNCTLFDF